MPAGKRRIIQSEQVFPRRSPADNSAWSPITQRIEHSANHRGQASRAAGLGGAQRADGENASSPKRKEPRRALFFCFSNLSLDAFACGNRGKGAGQYVLGPAQMEARLWLCRTCRTSSHLYTSSAQSQSPVRYLPFRF